MTTNKDKASNSGWTIVCICWIIASVSTLGSLFFSEIMELPPCALCWYQRIFMFPLVVILLVGLFPFDKSIIKYALPLALAGWGVAFYHYLLYSGFIPESIQPCSQGVSCSETYLDLEKIKKDMADPEIIKIINQDLADAKTLNVRKTPGFFVDGKSLTSFGYEQLQELVESEINEYY